MAPPLASTFSIDDLGRLDDEALRTFARPAPGGVDAADLVLALAGRPELCERVEAAVGGFGAGQGRSRIADDAVVVAARRRVVEALFWPLLYWLRPERYEELVAGEAVDAGLIAGIPVDGAIVADLGAGAGRLTLAIAARARRVIAVDAVPPLLARLDAHAKDGGIRNVETRRGGFDRLPLGDGEVDVAVACSSLCSTPPFGGDDAVREATRVVREGGELWVVWPDDPLYFVERGFHFVQSPPPLVRSFPSLEVARRVCADFYGPTALAWVESHRSPTVPYDVLDMRPPADACMMQVRHRAGLTPSR